MVNFDSYTVYDNRTNKIITTGSFAEIEDYLDCPGRYTVVSNFNGCVISE